MSTNSLDFSDLENMDALKGANEGAAPKNPKFEKRTPTDRAETLYSEPCGQCHGTGRYNAPSSYGHHCFKCNGKGVLTFKTPKAQREKAKKSAADRKERIANENQKAVEDANPGIAAWWTDTDFGFAIALRESARKFGSLTANQLAAANKCIASLAAKQKVIADAPTVNVKPIVAAMEKARKTLKKPSVTLLGGDAKINIRFASAYGNNAGALYVTHDDVYSGKIVPSDEKFIKGRDCTPEMEKDIIAAINDPEQQAIAYGRRFGICACCGRELSNQESIDRGIGPICASKYF